VTRRVSAADSFRATWRPGLPGWLRHATPLALFGVLLLPASGSAVVNEAELAPWVGRYAMELRVATTARLPLMPADRTTTITHMLVDLRRGTDGGVWQQHRVCAVRMENSSPMRTTVPPSFVNALPPRGYAVRLQPTSGGWRYEADMGMESIGFDPRRSGGRIPDAAGDPGVIDADGDGNPGATIEVRVPLVGTGRLFIAQQSHLVLRADAAGPRRISGIVEIRAMEQRTLDAEPGRFRRTPGIRPDPARSGFTMVRLPDGSGCTEVQQGVAHLFGPDGGAAAR
jgi:hypothetical protein